MRSLSAVLLWSVILMSCGGDGPGSGTAPKVLSTSPATGATGVSLNAKLSALFDLPMAPLSSTTFQVKQGSEPVQGTLAADGDQTRFTASSNLAPNTVYTATIAGTATSADGVALGADHSWSFTTGTTVWTGPQRVALGTSGGFAILAKTGISTVPPSAITGDIGLGPVAASYLTGFSLVADATNVFGTSPQITGKAYAADDAAPTPSNLTTAVGDMETAYTDAAGRPTPDFLELGSGNLGGKTLAPGLYKWTSSITIPTDVTISGGADDVWIFQTSGDLGLSASTHVLLAGGAQAKNVHWQVAGAVTLGATSHFEGVLLCKTQVTLETGATMNGRVLAQTQVALQQATVTQPAP